MERKVFRILRTPRRLDPQEVEVDPGFSHAPETELKDRKILKIRRKKEEEETLESTEEIAAAEAAAIEAEIKENTRAKKERRRDWADGKAMQWKNYYQNLEKATEEKVIRRLGNEYTRREEQSKAFVTWKVPVKLSSLQRAIHVEYNGELGLVTVEIA